MSILYKSEQGYYGGASIYSAALGAGGGFFVGGWELGKTTPITDSLFWDVSIFIGGGGGASQVSGDGLMLRPQIHAGYEVGEYRLGAGASWVSVLGSDISTPSFALTLSRPLNLELVGGHSTSGEVLGVATRVSVLSPIVRSYIPVKSQKRGGSDLQTMYLIGAEMNFVRDNSTEIFIQASGGVAGDAEGYADWILGKRYLWDVSPFKFLVDFGVGVGALTSFNGDFLAFTPTAKASIPFGSGASYGTDPDTVRWQISSGLTYLEISEDFRKPGATNNEPPVLINVDIDVFLLKNLYITGQAYNAIVGKAGGVQIGMFGIGYQYPVIDRLSLSGKILLGAAGGAGVDTRGGLLGATKPSSIIASVMW